jgi:hypothetical protein
MNIEELIVSGGSKEIYHLPGSLFEFHDTVMAYGGHNVPGVDYLFNIFDPYYYNHSSSIGMILDRDNEWSKELIEKYNREEHCHAAASAVLKIRNAFIKNSVLYFLNEDRYSILYESYRFPDRAGKVTELIDENSENILQINSNGRSYLYIGSAGSFNYGHWLVDDLPRAKAWLDLRDKMDVIPIILMPSHGDKMNDIRFQSLKELIDPNIEVEFIDPDKTIKISDIYFATPVSFHPRIKNPAAINFVRDQASYYVRKGYREPGRKLFVARRPPNSRSITNFDEVWAFLSARGFEMVEPENLNFVDQVTLFQNAKIVVGQMGAAMTSTMFCQPATPLIYLAPIGWAEPFYLDLAAVGGQHYNILAGPAANDGPAHMSDFSVPLGPLYHRMTYMGYMEIEKQS